MYQGAKLLNIFCFLPCGIVQLLYNQYDYEFSLIVKLILNKLEQRCDNELFG